MGIKKFLLFIFLGVFIYHLCSFVIHIGFEKLISRHEFIHLISFISAFILFMICCKNINHKDETSDDERHKINKIR